MNVPYANSCSVLQIASCGVPCNCNGANVHVLPRKSVHTHGMPNQESLTTRRPATSLKHCYTIIILQCKHCKKLRTCCMLGSPASSPYTKSPGSASARLTASSMPAADLANPRSVSCCWILSSSCWEAITGQTNGLRPAQTATLLTLLCNGKQRSRDNLLAITGARTT